MMLEGKVGIVTGAANGIGRATAIRMAAEGAKLGLMDIHGEGLEKTKELILSHTPEAEIICLNADISLEGQVRDAVEKLVCRFDKLNIAFNNAGISAGVGRPIHELDSADWEKAMTVNAFGTFFCAKYELVHMVKNGEPGSIVFTSSTGGIMGFPLGCGYNCSKHAIIGLMKNIMCDYAQYGIRSNAICPSQSDTPMNDANMDMLGLDEAGKAKFKRTRSPMRRISTPDEIAAAVVFLLSDDSSHVSGITMMIDGGQSATNENYFNWD